MKSKIFMLLAVLAVLLTSCTVTTVASGNHYPCDSQSHMDIANIKEKQVEVRFICETATWQAIYFTAPNEEGLLKIIRGMFSTNEHPTGVVLNGENYLVQLYHLTNVGIVVQNWPQP